MNRERNQTTAPEAAFFRHLCHAAGVALLAVDGDLNVCYYNHRAAELFGLPGAHHVDFAVEQIAPPDRRDELKSVLRRALDHGECAEFEFRYQDRHQRVHFLAVSIAPVQDEVGNRMGASASIQEITRRIELQEQVGQARKMRALGALAGNLAHHFNNILGGVVTAVDFTKGASDVRVLRKTLNSTAEALQRATSLLDGLLAFAAADYRDGDRADLTETILQFAERIRPELDQKHIELELKLSRVSVLEVPRNHFFTVLHNLANNAIDAMPQGGRLTLELEDDGAQVLFRMKDTGLGIIRENLERVFEPFYSTKTRNQVCGHGEHSGLGLSVSMGIVHEMGGEISVSSMAGQFTLVEIRLPLDPAKPLYKTWSENELLSPASRSDPATPE